MIINQHSWLYPKLPPENDVPELRDLRAKWDASPMQTTLHPTSIAGSKPLRIAMHVLGPGTNSHVYVFIHGMLADYRTWRYVAAGLPADAYIWLIDLPGHG